MEVKELIKEANKRAFELFKTNQFENAEEIYRQILRIDPDNSDALEMGSLTINHNGKPEQAISLARKAIAKNPHNFRLHNNLGLIYGSMDESTKAITCFEKAITLQPDQAFLHTNLAIELKKIKKHDKAFKIFKKAIKNFPDCEHVYFNYAAILHELGNVDKAIPLYEKALDIRYDFPVCHYNLSACWFLKGEYLKAWDEYEWRWQYFSKFAQVRDRFHKPYWRGQDLAGKTILLYSEQGAGDTIMFSRYIPFLSAKVLLECVPSLQPLFREHVEIYNGEQEFDYHCSLMSLPRIFQTTLDTIPPPLPLCSRGLKHSKDWANYRGFKIGICWTGNPMHPNDRNRSCPLRKFKALTGENIILFSLQKDIRAHHYPGIGTTDYLEGSESLQFIDMREFMDDFNCTAKIIENLDLVVTVDSVIAHLAATIGKETWLLLPYLPDWRWLLHTNQTPWYNNMRLFRQKHPGDWDGVFAEIVKELVQPVNSFAVIIS